MQNTKFHGADISTSRRGPLKYQPKTSGLKLLSQGYLRMTNLYFRFAVGSKL